MTNLKQMTDEDLERQCWINLVKMAAIIVFLVCLAVLCVVAAIKGIEFWPMSGYIVSASIGLIWWSWLLNRRIGGLLSECQRRLPADQSGHTKHPEDTH